jgi:CRISPR-associated endonuclease/helicase Cas3
MSGLTPYPYQKQIAKMLLIDGKNVILQAPTGAGKTHAALLPFMNALENKRNFPQRCIYSVPMRVLAKQFVADYEKAIKNAARNDRIRVSIQTGEQPDDRELTSNLIFATIDQTLSSYLLAPYSLGKRKANVNAGAVLSSYLVFDEFHLYDPGSTLPTTLFMLKNLKDLTPFVLMTATFSQVMLDELGEILNATVFPRTQTEREELENLPSQQKHRFYRVANHPLSARAILGTHEKRSLAICNTVDRARKLYDDLIALAPPEVEIILLHSRFLSEERNSIENRIAELFGKEADRKAGSAIVIATQAIEVGVDMSCSVLHSELAPANAIIQRAGRCARYRDETGTVYIYQHTINPEDVEKPLDLTDPENAAPYTSQKALFPATLNAFRERGGLFEFKFADEQAVISEVHNEQDAQLLKDLRAEGRTHATRIFAVQRGEEDARSLIREIQQQNLIIHADPQSLLKQPHATPLELPAFGLHPGTLKKYVRQWLERADTLGTWAVQILVDYGKELSKKDKKDAENHMQNNEDRYEWIECRSPADIQSAPLVVVNPLLATYDEKRGFVPDQGGDWQTPIPQPKDSTGSKESYTYRLETYRDHIRHVYEAFLENWWESEWAAHRLETQFGWQAGSVRRAAELTVLLHDVGKLSVGWQNWVKEYQVKIANDEDNMGLMVQPGEAYAHTERKTERHAEIERSMPKRPWHAVEGAVITSYIVSDDLNNEDLFVAVFAAIARHHSPYSEEYQPYRLVKNAQRHIAEAFADFTAIPDLMSLLETGQGEKVVGYIPNPDGETAKFLVYLLLVRSLRRADSAGTSAGRNVKL